jgi:TetR/AcrR family transcriptional regulator, regulator of biofilm formation and stress response
MTSEKEEVGTEHLVTRAPRGAARRMALIEAVLRIVAEAGAEAVSHRRVADEAGLPLASTTYWFDSKEHLLSAALEVAAERDIAGLHARVRQQKHLRGSTQAIVAALVGPLDGDPRTSTAPLVATYALLLEAARRPALRALARNWTNTYADTLRQLLESAGSDRPREDAVLLIGAANGLLIEQLTSGRNPDLRPQLGRMATALLDAP